MIKGIGVDLVEIKRFQDNSDLEGFMEQILTENESSGTMEHSRKHRIGARIFAIKEAIVKALGCGLTSGSYWHDIETGKKSLIVLTGFLGRLAIKQSISKIHFSHSSSKRFSVAVVILEE